MKQMTAGHLQHEFIYRVLPTVVGAIVWLIARGNRNLGWGLTYWLWANQLFHGGALLTYPKPDVTYKVVTSESNVPLVFQCTYWGAASNTKARNPAKENMPYAASLSLRGPRVQPPGSKPSTQKLLGYFLVPPSITAKLQQLSGPVVFMQLRVGNRHMPVMSDDDEALMEVRVAKELLRLSLLPHIVELYLYCHGWGAEEILAAEAG